MSIEARNARWAWETQKLTACAYMDLHNTGERSVALVSVSSPDFRYANLVTTTEEEGEQVKAGLDRITVSDETSLVPGDNRLQLDAPTYPLQDGDPVEIVLSLSDGSRLTVTADWGADAP
ncbi:copper chaperone PCu(A)C [Nocardiopsis salina]|uniref:copper chaperone PCu(A)C n=1 Tax=Nocardiopsis salina TaxID=245836 RepID=UPI000349E415|nr:copper chaperone PCu(A)C [Nocardiopsis salina]